MQYAVHTMHPELLNKSCVKTLANVQIYLLGSKLRILSAAGEQVQFKDAQSTLVQEIMMTNLKVVAWEYVKNTDFSAQTN